MQGYIEHIEDNVVDVLGVDYIEVDIIRDFIFDIEQYLQDLISNIDDRDELEHVLKCLSEDLYGESENVSVLWEHIPSKEESLDKIKELVDEYFDEHYANEKENE